MHENLYNDPDRADPGASRVRPRGLDRLGLARHDMDWVGRVAGLEAPLRDEPHNRGSHKQDDGIDGLVEICRVLGAAHPAHTDRCEIRTFGRGAV